MDKVIMINQGTAVMEVLPANTMIDVVDTQEIEMVEPVVQMIVE